MTSPADDSANLLVAFTRFEAEALQRAAAFGAYDLSRTDMLDDAGWSALDGARTKLAQALEELNALAPPVDSDYGTEDPATGSGST